ncbi:MAG: hypothetical protein V3V09_06380 [Arenicellales bacterium]
MLNATTMLEYLFFNIEFAEKFIVFLKQKDLAYTQATEAVQNAILIKTSEDIEDDLWDELDAFYDDLSEHDHQQLQDTFKDDDKINTAGIYIQLKDDQQTIANINPDVMNRMLENISMDEFNEFIETIVSSVETPDDSPICQQ